MNLYGKSAWLAVILLLTAAAYGTERIANSKHDLSVSSPHPIRAIDEERICVGLHLLLGSEVHPECEPTLLELWLRFPVVQISAGPC